MRAIIITLALLISSASWGQAATYGLGPAPAATSSAVAGTSSITATGIPILIGPCDIITSGGQTCVAAHSVTRRMFGSYAGALFQLTRASDSTTQDVSTTANGMVNLSTVTTFCLATDCWFSSIYDQAGNANHLPQATAASMAPWWLYNSNGLPILITAQNDAFYRNRASTTNIPTGAASSTTYYVRATDINSADGDYGRMETTVTGSPAGAMWANAYSSFAGALGLGVDVEGTVPNAPVASIPSVVGLITKYTNSTALMTIKWVNVSTGVPQIIAIQAPNQTPVVQSGLSIGEGGDGTFASSEFFEGAVITGVTSDATDLSLAANVKAFYGAATFSYPGPVDIALQSNVCAGALCANNSKRDISAVSGGAWGLRKLRASYQGYAVNIIRASDSATQNIGFTATGDFDDVAAQQFCAGTTCTITRAYNQALHTIDNNTNAAVYDMVQVTANKQPQLIFNALNGRSIMRSNGSQYLCTGAITTLGKGWTMNAVAHRTGNTGVITQALSSNGAQGDIGWAASPDTGRLNPGASGTIITFTATDASWHSLFGSVTDTAGDLSAQADNGAPVTASGSLFAQPGSFHSIFSSSFGASCGTPNAVMTGDIAEALMVGSAGSGAAATGVALSATQITAIYNNQHAYYGGAF